MNDPYSPAFLSDPRMMQGEDFFARMTPRQRMAYLLGQRPQGEAMRQSAPRDETGPQTQPGAMPSPYAMSAAAQQQQANPGAAYQQAPTPQPMIQQPPMSGVLPDATVTQAISGAVASANGLQGQAAQDAQGNDINQSIIREILERLG